MEGRGDSAIIKKGEGDRFEEYRGITLLSSAYKVHAMILVERLNEEIERGGIIPSNQAVFRRGWKLLTIYMCLSI